MSVLIEHLKENYKGINYHIVHIKKPCTETVNGYIEIEPTSEWFGVHYDELPLDLHNDVHSGVTYVGNLDYIWDETKDRWFIGFDTNGSDDTFITTKNIPFVRNHCKEIINKYFNEIVGNIEEEIIEEEIDE